MLVAGIGAGIEVVLLDATRDGVTQIADALAGREALVALHVISHGSEGELALGSGQVDTDSIRGEHAAALARIGAALGEGADILVYGCDFGAGDVGRAAAAALGAATGADVAASDDLTGAAALGGDWTLEHATGAVEASALAAPAFDGLLVAPVAGDDPGAGSPTAGDVQGATLAAAGGAATASFSGSDGATFALVRGDANAITADGSAGLGLGRLGADGGVGESESYALTLDRPENSVSLSFTRLDSSVSGREELQAFRAFDVYGNEIVASLSLIDESPAGSSVALVAGAGGAVNTIRAGNGSTDGRGRLTISSERPIARVEFSRAVTSVAAMAPGTQGVTFTELEYSSSGATDPYHTTDRSTAISVPVLQGLLDNDIDADGDALAITAINGTAYTPGNALPLPSGAIITVAADGAVDYDPNGAFDAFTTTQTDSFTYEVTAGGETDTATVTFTIVPNNDRAPVANDDAFTVTAGRTVTIQPLGNDTDPDGPLPASGAVIALIDGATRIDLGASGTPYGTPVTLASGTEVVVLADGRMQVTAPAGASGDESLDYVVSDGELEDVGEITLTRADEFAPVVSLNAPTPPGLSGLTATTTPTVTGNGAGQVALYENAATALGQPLSVRATVQSSTSSSLTWSTSGDDLVLDIGTGGGAETVEVLFEVLDQVGGVTGTVGAVIPGAAQLAVDRLDAGQSFSLPSDEVSRFVTEDPTAIVVSQSAASLRFSGTTTGIDTSAQDVGFTTVERPGALVTFELSAGASTTAFRLDGNGDVDAGFTSPRTVFEPNDIDFATTWNEGGGPVPIADPNAFISDFDNATLEAATIVLGNASTGDTLDVPATLPGGIVAAPLDTSVPGRVTLALSGTASLVDYAAAIRAIGFDNTAASPEAGDRAVTVTVTDGTLDSPPATTTVTVVSNDDTPVVTLDADNSAGNAPRLLRPVCRERSAGRCRGHRRGRRRPRRRRRERAARGDRRRRGRGERGVHHRALGHRRWRRHGHHDRALPRQREPHRDQRAGRRRPGRHRLHRQRRRRHLSHAVVRWRRRAHQRRDAGRAGARLPVREPRQHADCRR